MKDKPAFDATGISNTIKRSLQLAGLNIESGLMKGVTDTIDHALTTAGLRVDPAPRNGRQPSEAQGDVFDVEAREVDAGGGHVVLEPTVNAQESETHEVEAQEVEAHGVEVPNVKARNIDIVGDRADPVVEVDRRAPGRFISGSFSNAAGSRNYKLYVPSSAAGAPPLIVMLHGCQQSPDDFAAGTQMNSWADRHGFLVLYPEQGQAGNASRCWNWFRKLHQRRDSGEPSILAGMSRDVAKQHRADPQQVFVAGLSAGAAMAVILGETYPEVFSAVGAHSGLARGVAHDVKSALGAMNGKHSQRNAMRSGSSANDGASVPTIVFHGDADATVNVSNGLLIVDHAIGPRDESVTDPSQEVQSGAAPGGRRYTRSVYMDSQGRPIVEKWIVHGGGHAWSGGSPAGSFTDARGPDASAEMIRFFLAERRSSGR